MFIGKTLSGIAEKETTDLMVRPRRKLMSLVLSIRHIAINHRESPMQFKNVFIVHRESFPGQSEVGITITLRSFWQSMANER